MGLWNLDSSISTIMPLPPIMWSSSLIYSSRLLATSCLNRPNNQAMVAVECPVSFWIVTEVVWANHRWPTNKTLLQGI